MTTAPVVLEPATGVSQHAVGLLDVLVPLLGHAVPGVHTGMVASSEPAIGPLDVGP
jgi:hypothetical protein